MSPAIFSDLKIRISQGIHSYIEKKKARIGGLGVGLV
jgi:hypothetical protein